MGVLTVNSLQKVINDERTNEMVNHTNSVSKIRKVGQLHGENNLRSKNLKAVDNRARCRSDKGDLKAGHRNKDKSRGNYTDVVSIYADNNHVVGTKQVNNTRNRCRTE